MVRSLSCADFSNNSLLRLGHEEIEKRFDAALDLVRWLDQRIAQQVEYQVEKRLAQERENWRCHVVGLIAAELERLVALLEAECRRLSGRFGAANESKGARVQYS